MLNNESRRQFFRFLASSPLLAQAFGQDAAKLTDAKEALSVMDFEPLARQTLPPAHLGYMLSGVDDDLTLKANRDAMQKFFIRPRRLVDTTKLSTRTELFGERLESPIYISAVGALKMFHRDGEAAVARAVTARKAEMMLSTQTSTAVEEVVKAAGKPVWYQLYTAPRWAATETIVKRAEQAGCKVMFFTVDLLGGRNTETATRLRRLDTRDCTSCHGPGGPGSVPRPMVANLETASPLTPNESLTWDRVERLKQITSMKVVIKGIDTGEDALMAREHGADGVLVSNHGGRSAETGRGTMEALEEVIAAVGPNLPVLVDGGFRRGTDVFKALALGARAVGIGRPYIWGLSTFGQAGVERVLEILNAELTLSMHQFGTPTIGDITRARVGKRA
jgi:4-hydroxymandelate oxidase